MPSFAPLNLLAIGVVLLISAIQMFRRPRYRNMEGLFLTAFLQIVVLFVDNWCLALVTRLTSIRYDQYVFCFDRLFGSPSFFVGRLFASYPIYRDISFCAYVLAPAVCLAVATACFFLSKFEDAVWFVLSIFWSCLLAYLFFAVFPVAGPKYAFSTFPFAAPQSLIPHVIYLRAIPNGVPSVHMTLALIVFWFARRWAIGRVLGSIFVFLTASATLGLGEHYLFDLIAAVPYTCLMIYVAGYSTAKMENTLAMDRTQELAVRAVELKS